MNYHFILKKEKQTIYVSETNHPEGYPFNELEKVINNVTTLHLMEKPENIIQKIYPKIDWEQVWDVAQFMTLSEFINYQKEKYDI